jgi:DNA excision repair protein ERCC-5
VGFFRRICKLLFFGIQPVFVFDGGAPVLKRQTVLGRKKRREGRLEDAARTAGRLLVVQMKKRGEEEEERRKRESQKAKEGKKAIVGEEDETLPNEGEMVYVGELGMSAQERTATRKFHKKDAYHLPELTNGIEGMGQPNDPRIMSAEELDEYARQFNNGEDVNLYDFSKIDFNSEFFMSLPAGDRYNILNAARLRSRLRMGLSKQQLEDMFPDRMAFSRFQIERVRERNELTQRLMNLNGMNDDIVGVGGGRIAGESGREYVLVKNDGVEGGWALGVVSTDKMVGKREKPIDVDAFHQKDKENQEPEESEDEFEDVPVEGLNRLPNPKFDNQNLTYEDFQAQEIANQRRQIYASRNGESSKRLQESSLEPDSLFVNNDVKFGERDAVDADAEDLEQAITMSLQNDLYGDEMDEEEHLNRAIALSLQKNHHQEPQPEEDEDFEDVMMPVYEQQAVADPKPIANTIANTPGRMVAHIINNRANATVPRIRAASVSSNSDMDLQSALSKARKQKASRKNRQPTSIAPDTRHQFEGPLPFEKLDFRTSIFGKRGTELNQDLGNDSEDDNVEDMEGGFEKEDVEEKSKPLPPWLVGNQDVIEQVQEQRRLDRELNAEDRERALEEERAWRKKNAPIEVDSSDNESDVEILDAIPPPTETMDDLAKDIGAVPRVSNFSEDRYPTPQVEPLPSPEEEIHEDPESEEVEWSESDHGDVATRSAKVADPVGRENDGPSFQSRSTSTEFEDVEVSARDGAEQITPVKNRQRQFEDVEKEAAGASLTSDRFPEMSASAGISTAHQNDLVGDSDFDEFSDPDDEELLAQLAMEAEEHARFASTLNNKSEKENQESYERELKALRSQQQKDRRDADEVTHIMITECQALLRLFGLPYITAPMEAEAQCAELVRLGLVDGIVTDDSDIFLFGGTRVYKNMFNSNKFVECYLSSDLEKELSLSRDQLISIAHLLGSDYTEGLPGIGPVTALEIISEFPSQHGLEEFKEWWSSAQLSIHSLSTEKSKFRKKFLRSQGTKLFLPPTFPSPAVTEAYLKPEVDSNPEPFQWGVPDLDRLRDFLMATIGWSQERTDEVLVPVIRDMNRRETEGTQSNITRFFEGAVGAGANTSGRRDPGSKRMREAVGKLKAKKGGNSATFAQAAAEWAERNGLGQVEGEKEKEKAKKSKGRGKKRAVVEHEDEDQDEPEPIAKDGEGEGEGVGEDAGDESGSGDEYGKTAPRSTGKRKGKPQARGRRKRTKG